MGDGSAARLENDAFFLGGEDIEDVRRAMEAKQAEIRGQGGEVFNERFETTHRGEVPFAEARFDYRLPADRIGAEVDFAADSVEDRVEE